MTRMDPNLTLKARAVEFTAVVNIAFLMLMAIVACPAFFSDQWTKESALTQLVLIQGAILFNLVMFAATSKGNGDVRLGMNHLFDSLEQVLLTMRRGWLILWARFLVTCQSLKVILRTPLQLPAKPSSKAEKLSSRTKLRSTTILSPKVPRIKIRRAESERSYPIENQRLLRIKEKYMSTRSPELFKNKVFVTRKSLIESQDEDSQ